MYSFLGIASQCHNFHIHVYASNLYIPWISPHISCSRIGRSIVGIFKSLTDTWMWKLGLWPCNSFSGNICIWIFGIASLHCEVAPETWYYYKQVVKNRILSKRFWSDYWAAAPLLRLRRLQIIFKQIGNDEPLSGTDAQVARDKAALRRLATTVSFGKYAMERHIKWRSYFLFLDQKPLFSPFKRPGFRKIACWTYATVCILNVFSTTHLFGWTKPLLSWLWNSMVLLARHWNLAGQSL
jgi:hypothetical protein